MRGFQPGAHIVPKYADGGLVQRALGLLGGRKKQIVAVKGEVIMEVKPIRDNASYRAALRQVSALIDRDPSPQSPEGELLEVLGTLVQAYEEAHYPIAAPDPISAIKFMMEQKGMSVKDMVPYIGPSNRVYEVLNGKRQLSMDMVRRLLTLGIPASSLIGSPMPVRQMSARELEVA